MVQKFRGLALGQAQGGVPLALHGANDLPGDVKRQRARGGGGGKDPRAAAVAPELGREQQPPPGPKVYFAPQLLRLAPWRRLADVVVVATVAPAPAAPVAGATADADAGATAGATTTEAVVLVVALGPRPDGRAPRGRTLAAAAVGHKPHAHLPSTGGAGGGGGPL